MERLIIPMVLLKNCPMGKAGTEIVVDTEHTRDYFIKTGKAKLKTETPSAGVSELPKQQEPDQKQAPAKKTTKKTTKK